MSCAGGCGFHGGQAIEGFTGLFCSLCAKNPQQKTADTAQGLAAECAPSLAWACPGCLEMQMPVNLPLHLETCDICFSERPMAPPTPEQLVASVAAAADSGSSLVLRGIALDEATMDMLCAALDGKCGGLREIVVNHCQLDDDLTMQFAHRVLSQCNTLNCLDLAYNHWSDAGLASVVDALTASHAPVQELYLSHGQAETLNSVAPLMAFLAADTCCVRKLQLDECKIGDDGARALAEALKTNRTIERLELVAVGMSQQGADALLSVVQETRVVRHLSLAGNEVAGDFDARLQSALAINR